MKQKEPIKTPEDLDRMIEQEEALLVYFSHAACNVCKVLKPKVATMLEEHFPKVRMLYIDTVQQPEIPAQKGIFAVPTMIVYLAGREYFRWSRTVSVEQMRKEIQRPYQMMFA